MTINWTKCCQILTLQSNVISSLLSQTLQVIISSKTIKTPFPTLYAAALEDFKVEATFLTDMKASSSDVNTLQFLQNFWFGLSHLLWKFKPQQHSTRVQLHKAHAPFLDRAFLMLLQIWVGFSYKFITFIVIRSQKEFLKNNVQS